MKTVGLQEMIRLLEPLAKQEGIRFEKLRANANWPEEDNVFPAPFSDHLGVILPGVVIYRKGAEATELIHEMGHLLFGMDDPEFGWMGWEWSVARLLGVEAQWLHTNRDYGVPLPNGELIDLKDIEDLGELFEDRVRAAVQGGIKLPVIRGTKNDFSGLSQDQPSQTR